MLYYKTIYAIQHEITKKIYVGKSQDVMSRFKTHMSHLKCGTHSVEDMQKDCDEYGDKFTLFILQEKSEDRLDEYKWMKRFNSHIRGIGYNYKDPIVNRINLELPTPLPLNTVNELIDYEKPQTKLINSIVKLLNQTKDLDLVDLVYQLLKKEANKCT